MAILFSRLIAFVECCVVVQGQSDRLEDDDAGAGDPLPLARGEGAPHHGQTVKSRQAADFSRKRSANLNARNRAAAPRT